MSGILESLKNIQTIDDLSFNNIPALESEIVLTAIRESCSSDEEFDALMKEAATEMALYGVIDDADVATEASKRIVIDNFKQVNFRRIEKRTAIRLAAINKDQLYAKYRKYRDLFLQTRVAIYKKYGAKAAKEAKKILLNARRKSANMPSPAGKTIVDKIDKQIDKATSD